ncbi:MAG: LssY C-terminal domain-containing protein [Nitrospirota bacterium]|nr:MAG: LssY C-terminal domain-containing protein [Nitrospirota bacterium]
MRDLFPRLRSNLSDRPVSSGFPVFLFLPLALTLPLSPQGRGKRLIQISQCHLPVSWLLGIAFLSGCASYTPPTSVATEFLSRAKTQKEGSVGVSAVVLSAEESEQVFAADLAKNDIQSQDAALKKARASVDERNHLRLWRAPVNFQGTPVWVGQISRDIGVKLSSKTVVTHKIDPVVDEARTYVGLDLLVSQYLGQVGYFGEVGISSRSAPRFNYTKDPYYTDGLRIVLFLTENPLAYDEIQGLDWEQPATRLKKEEPDE